MKLSLKNLSKTKKILLFVGGPLVILVVAAVVYAILSSARYTDHNNQLYSDAKQAIDNRMYADELSIQSLVDISSTASGASDKLCQTSFITKSIVSDDQLSSCESSQAKLADVASRATTVADYLQAEQSVASLFDKASTNLTDVKPGDYDGQKQVWAEASQALANFSSPDIYADQLATHQAAIDEIIKGYDGVIKADKAEKRDKFDDAVADLQDAYDDLSGTKDEDTAYLGSTNQLLDAIELL